MTLRLFSPRLFSLSLLASVLVGCATVPAPEVRRNAVLDSHQVVAGDGSRDGVNAEPLEATGAPQPVIRRGTGTMINRSAAAAAAPSLGQAGNGTATFNFEGESVHAVVKAILGDMLGQNYVIAPGVQGTVTLATPKPVSSAQALNLLEMVLGWNNARMVYSGGRYNIVAADQALAGTVAPSTAPAANARGFEVRVIPLQYISATEMKKVLEPYARPNAIVNVDSGRNVITLGGTRSELENYLRTVEIFDVDWLSGMSVGVFPIQTGKAEQVAADLEKVFGEESKTPSAGMFRFLPLENANAVLVITRRRGISIRSNSGWSASTPPVAAHGCSPTSCVTSRPRTWPSASPKPSPTRTAAVGAAAAVHWHRAPPRWTWAAATTLTTASRSTPGPAAAVAAAGWARAP